MGDIYIYTYRKNATHLVFNAINVKGIKYGIEYGRVLTKCNKKSSVALRGRILYSV